MVNLTFRVPNQALPIRSRLSVDVSNGDPRIFAGSLGGYGLARIDVDFEVFKELTVRRASESVTYNDVIRELLGLRNEVATTPKPNGMWIYRGVQFPDGTQFRATYKGTTYTAEVRGGSLMLNGQRQTSPSAAASSITESNTNGWDFWEVKRPGDASWRIMKQLR
jgi:hypothetical protein